MFGSACVLVQTPLHSVWFEEQGICATQAPELQTCAGEASALPQLVPFGALGFEQVPLAGLHTPATWQTSTAEHVTGLLPVQTPLWQESLCVQALPSLQAVPLGAAGLEQVPVFGSQLPAA